MLSGRNAVRHALRQKVHIGCNIRDIKVFPVLRKGRVLRLRVLAHQTKQPDYHAHRGAEDTKMKTGRP